MSHGYTLQLKDFTPARTLEPLLVKTRILFVDGEDCSPDLYLLEKKQANKIEIHAGDTHYPLRYSCSVGLLGHCNVCVHSQSVHPETVAALTDLVKNKSAADLVPIIANVEDLLCQLAKQIEDDKIVHRGYFLSAKINTLAGTEARKIKRLLLPFGHVTVSPHGASCQEGDPVAATFRVECESPELRAKAKALLANVECKEWEDVEEEYANGKKLKRKNLLQVFAPVTKVGYEVPENERLRVQLRTASLLNLSSKYDHVCLEMELEKYASEAAIQYAVKALEDHALCKVSAYESLY